MGSDSELPERRRATRNINYNEKDADVDLVKRIQQMEKSRKSIASSSKAKVPKTKYQDFLNTKSIGWNFIPSLPPSFRKQSRFSNILDLEGTLIDLTNDTLIYGSSILLKKNDHIYMVSEPPGEPYYIGRIVKFVVKPEYRTTIKECRDIQRFPAKYFQVKMNWYYRPRDVQEKVQNLNSRLLYASMHVDICPIYSYRGKCNVVHKPVSTPIEDFQKDLLTKPNTFFFEQLFDRYTLQYYDVWSTQKQLSVLEPDSVYLNSLANMYPFVFAEEGYPLDRVVSKYIMGKEGRDDQLWDYKCGECGGWCEKNQWVKCDECHIYVHLFCLDPPLDRKPIKGVVWICSRCISYEENKENVVDHPQSVDRTLETVNNDKEINKELASKTFAENSENLWFYYLGSKVVDHLYDILCPELLLPFPIKPSRTGFKYQWSGCNSPTWEPKPYESNEVGRGSEATAELLWVTEPSKLALTDLDTYVQECQSLIPHRLNIMPQGCNFLDMVLKILLRYNYKTNVALNYCDKTITREALQEPTFTDEEVARFEEGIAEYGSELHPVCKLVGTQPMAMIVRFYYYWKKTPNGRQIWGNFKGRKKNKNKSLISTKKGADDRNKKSRVRKPSKILRDNEMNSSKEWRHVDDSSFDSEKISNVKTCFQCMFCDVDYSPLWYRITGGCDDEHIRSRMNAGVVEKTSTSDKVSVRAQKSSKTINNNILEALCIRCARIWRRYAVKWSNPIDVLKRLHGKYASSVREALDELLEDPADMSIKVPLNLLSEKSVEWELAQDAELIIKQRFNMLDDSERFLKMKRNCLAVHAQLNKAVKRLVDKDAFSEKLMREELESFIDSAIYEARKKDKKPKKPKGEKPAVKSRPSSQMEHNKSNNAIDGSGVGNGHGTQENFATPASRELISKKLVVPFEKEKEHIPKDFLHTIASEEHEVDVFRDARKAKMGQIIIDPEFENLKLSDELFSALFDRDPNCAVVQTSSTNSKDSGAKRPPKSALGKDERGRYDPKEFQITNSSNIPIISTFSISKILEAYHSHNPLYFEWYRGKIPKITFEAIQNVTRGTYQVAQNNLGRKSKPSSIAPCNSGVEGSSSPRNFCCVCLENFRDDLDEEIICANCGLNVHYFCYGIKIPGSLKNLKVRSDSKSLQWLCDPCSNDLNPISTTNYQCSLCHAKELDYENGRKKLSRSIPDGLKLASDGSWCHISCSLFNPQLFFSSGANLQVAGNISASLLNFKDEVCKICGGAGGGLVKCKHCTYMSHVTCAQDTRACSIRFQKNFVQNSDEGYQIIKDRDQSFILEPVILCPEHQTHLKDTVPLNERTQSGVSLLQLFCEFYKNPPSIDRGKIPLKTVDRFAGQTGLIPLSSGAIEGDDAIEAVQCMKCSRKSSISWYNGLCHACHYGISDPKFNLLLNEKLIEDKEIESDKLTRESLLKDIHLLKPPTTAQNGTKRALNGEPSKARKRVRVVKSQTVGRSSSPVSVVVQDLGK